ncbi:MAG: hypothetical protein M3081_03265 [Gemmatimonadota bacterium]|nr:hypothetical protein [Gemmatimonadota bacterium]
MEDAIAFAVVMATIVGSVLGGGFGLMAIRRRFSRGSVVEPAELRSVHEQLVQLQTAIDTMAVEVERISEGQRFTTKLLSEKSTQRGA